MQADALLAESPLGKEKAPLASPNRAVLPSESNTAPPDEAEKKTKTAGKNKKEGRQGKSAKTEKPRAEAEGSPVTVEAAEAAAAGDEGSSSIVETGDIEAPVRMTSLVGGRVEGGATSPVEDGFLVEWRAESEVLAWSQSAPSSGSNTPTLRRLKGPVRDPFSIGEQSTRQCVCFYVCAGPTLREHCSPLSPSPS